MRRLFLFFCLMCFASIVSAQRTYYYKQVKQIRSDGSMYKGDGTRYITFTNEGTMYISNEDGTVNNNFGHYIYYYRGEVKGCWWYCVKGISYTGYGLYRRAVEYWREDVWGYYLVSKDYTTINFVSGGTTYVYQRCTPEDNVPGLIK